MKCFIAIALLALFAFCAPTQALTRTEVALAARSEQAPVVPFVAPPVSIECELCHVIVQVVEGWIEANKTEDAIQKDLQAFCNFFTRQSKTTCSNIAEKDTHAIIEWIKTKEDPYEACSKSQLGYCDNVSLAEKAQAAFDLKRM
eukprot:TRINITY_DN15353_c0_g2_i3.p2 TRINITY_DN15353_c0_g2~~TRINITY_DN15353_c0_g2_i3.p2  ORF type:complete len:159 (-),score=58.10 TRINITY_DN15353_c0_g2_i3:84-515(-)